MYPLKRKTKCWLTVYGILCSHNLSNHLCHLYSKNLTKCWVGNCHLINWAIMLADNLLRPLFMANRRLWWEQFSLSTRNYFCRKLWDENRELNVQLNLLRKRKQGGKKISNFQQRMRRKVIDYYNNRGICWGGKGWGDRLEDYSQGKMRKRI